ncbi:MAG: hypothetical protein ACT4PK_11765 [Gammaproteobacteria bacterium]
MSRLGAAWLLPVLTGLAACNGSDPYASQSSGMVGPCVVFTATDAILTVDTASGTATNATIGEAVLNTFAVNGQPRTAAQAKTSVSSNVVVEGDTLRCTLPCSFGAEAGEWTFTAEAPGYDPTLQEATAAPYNSSGTGCPGYTTGTTHISLTLDEAGP